MRLCCPGILPGDQSTALTSLCGLGPTAASPVSPDVKVPSPVQPGPALPHELVSLLLGLRHGGAGEGWAWSQRKGT